MIIRINGTNDGWGEYVLNGTKKKPRDHSKVKVLKGDIQLGDIITDHPNYRQNAYSIILSFKGKPKLETMDAVLNDFEKLFMHGFDTNEYHFDAVLHKDTDDYHIHIRIPKLNLYTGTQLQLYLDKKDRKRVNLIRNLLDMKYNLENPQNNRKLIKEEQDYQIEKWNQKFTKNSRKDIKKHLHNIIRELHQANLLNSLDDVQQVLEDLSCEVIKAGYDSYRDFYYLTVKHNGAKIRLIGDIYHGKFWHNSPESRAIQITNNRQARGSFEYNREEYDRVSNELKIALVNRTEEIEARYNPARKRATSRVSYTQQKDKEILAYQTKSVQEKRTTVTKDSASYISTIDSNLFDDKLSNSYAITNEQMAHPKAIQVKTRQWQLYDYTFEQRFLLKKATRILLKTGGLDGTINGNTLNEDSKIREKRKSINRLTKSGQETLFRKAQFAVRRMGETRSNRKRYKQKIVKLGTKYAKIEQQFYTNLTKIDTIIRAITEATDDSGVTNKPTKTPTLQEYEETYEPIQFIELY